jgi:hypothetical protein
MNRTQRTKTFKLAEGQQHQGPPDLAWDPPGRPDHLRLPEQPYGPHH